MRNACLRTAMGKPQTFVTSPDTAQSSSGNSKQLLRHVNALGDLACIS